MFDVTAVKPSVETMIERALSRNLAVEALTTNTPREGNPEKVVPEEHVLWLDICADDPALSRVCIATREVFELPVEFEDERLANGRFIVIQFSLSFSYLLLICQDCFYRILRRFDEEPLAMDLKMHMLHGLSLQCV